jgi:hypothetical protein
MTDGAVNQSPGMNEREGLWLDRRRMEFSNADSARRISFSAKRSRTASLPSAMLAKALTCALPPHQRGSR